MFEAFMKIVADLTDGGRPPSGYGESDYRLAAAALLVHTASIDGGAELERERLHTIIKQRFSLDDAAADELIAEATEADNNATDLYRFTVKLNRELDARARARMVEMMWQIVYADGVVTEVESNLVWRAADLLSVSREERIALRNMVANAQGGKQADKSQADNSQAFKQCQ
jgi:uncharacterized tellurite resistance protein B-like protein